MTKMPTGVQNTLCEHPTILAKTEYRGHRIKGNQEGKYSLDRCSMVA